MYKRILFCNEITLPDIGNQTCPKTPIIEIQKGKSFFCIYLFTKNKSDEHSVLCFPLFFFFLFRYQLILKKTFLERYKANEESCLVPIRIVVEL